MAGIPENFNPMSLNGTKVALPSQELKTTTDSETIRGKVPVNDDYFEITTSSRIIRYESDGEGGWRQIYDGVKNDGDKHGVYTYYYGEDLNGGGYYTYKNEVTKEYVVYNLDGTPRY